MQRQPVLRRQRGPARPCAIAMMALVVGMSVVPVAHANDQLKLPDLLTPLTDPTDDWRVRKTLRGGTVEIYGQFSMSVLTYDDGAGSETYVPVGNGNASARLGFRWQLNPIGSARAMIRGEFGLPLQTSDQISQTGDGYDWFTGSFKVRKFEYVIDSDSWGTMSIGQGSMANDGVAEIDLSETRIGAFSAVEKPAADQFLRLSGGGLSPLTIGDVFDNFDGDSVKGFNSDGSRKLRLRYDAPAYSGVRLSVATGIDTQDRTSESFHDVTLRHEKRYGDWKAAAGVGYALKGSERITSGSFSILDETSGLNVTLAAGTSDLSRNYSYLKLGLIRDLLPWGSTAFSIDSYWGKDIGGPGSRSRSLGLAIVQRIDEHNVELFGLLREYSFSDNSASYQSSRAAMLGMRWKF